MSIDVQISEETFSKLIAPFKKRGEKKVFIASCCLRQYVGLQPATICRTCQKPVKNEERFLENECDGV